MATAMVSAAPPTGVSKDEIWTKCRSMALSTARGKAKEAVMQEKFYSFATFAGTSLGMGFLFAKFPAAEEVAGINTKWIVGGLSVGYALFSKGAMSHRALDVGLAALGPSLYELGASIALR